jgi:hypothetical protein
VTQVRSEWRTVCECGNEKYGSTKCGDLLSSRFQFLRRDSAVGRVGLTQIT